MTRATLFLIGSLMFLKLSSVLAQDEFPPLEEPVAMQSIDLETISMAFTIVYTVLLVLAVLCLVFAIIHRKKLAHDLERQPLVGAIVPPALAGANLNNVVYENQLKLSQEIREGERLIWAYQSTPRFPNLPIILACIGMALCLFGLGFSGSIFGLIKAGEKIPFVDEMMFPEAVLFVPCSIAAMITFVMLLTSTLIRMSYKNLALYGITNNRLFIISHARLNCCVSYDGVRELDLVGIRDIRVMHTSSSRGSIFLSSNNAPMFYGSRARLLGFAFYNIPQVNEVRDIIENHRHAAK